MSDSKSCSAPGRREFMKRTVLAAGAAAGFPYIIPSSALGLAGTVAPSNRITMGSIGLGGQGTRDMEQFLRMKDVQVVALCDVDAGSTNYEQGWLRGLAPAKEEVEKHYAEQQPDGKYKGCDGYNDFRELLACDDIDAVTIGTPDHWHAIIAIHAANAGKDMYCQKPMSYSIEEGRAMVTAVEKNNSVFQCGSQRRSEFPCRRACEAVRNGDIGDLQQIRIGLSGGHDNPGYTRSDETMPVPDGFDYNTWLGPAPDAHYTHDRCHWTFRWNLDYSKGKLTDWGAHFIDMAHWGLGADDTGPVTVEGTATFPPREDLWNTATEFSFDCEYVNGVRMHVDSGNHGVDFMGTEGSVNLGGIVQRNDGKKIREREHKIKLYNSNNHYLNFIECVKSRERTAAPAEAAHRAISVAHLAHIAMVTGRKIQWDPEKELIIGDDEANKMLGRSMRAPWSLETL